MKFISCIILIAALSMGTPAKAQLPYAFTKNTSTYAALPTATKHIISGPWGPTFTLIVSEAIGIDMFNTTCDNSTFSVNSEGGVSFHAHFSGDEYFASGMGTPANGYIGEVSYEMTGNFPDHLLKVQYKNVYFAAETTATSYINFQVWFYENGDIIELHYGPNVYTPGTGAGISPGLFDVVVATENSIELYGDPAAPTASTGIYKVGTSLTGFPASGTVYRFTPNPTAVQQLSKKPAGIIVTYQPNDHHVSLSSAGTMRSCEISDLSGKTIEVFKNINADHFTINTQNYPKAMYIIKTLFDDHTDVKMINVAQ